MASYCLEVDGGKRGKVQRSERESRYRRVLWDCALMPGDRAGDKPVESASHITIAVKAGSPGG